MLSFKLSIVRNLKSSISACLLPSLFNPYSVFCVRRGTHVSKPENGWSGAWWGRVAKSRTRLAGLHPHVHLSCISCGRVANSIGRIFAWSPSISAGHRGGAHTESAPAAAVAYDWNLICAARAIAYELPGVGAGHRLPIQRHRLIPGLYISSKWQLQYSEKINVDTPLGSDTEHYSIPHSTW